MKHFESARQNFLAVESTFSSFATRSLEALRFQAIENDIRTPFFRDVDRIIHALSYTRYADKTQVYAFKENDHISERMLHVQLVSKIARTIGRGLGLNTDLIEAIALGHDVGHTPLGHTGEALLNEISKRELNEYFAHNIQSVRHYLAIENGGVGLNLTVQVLDGIMCHNGEMLSNVYIPASKTKEEFLRQYQEAYSDLKKSAANRPMTLEGCVVRISDIIGYIGRDIEDAINLGLFHRADIPKKISAVLGNNNKDIVNTIVTDVIDQSFNQSYIKLSEPVYQALFCLKKFNYENIYQKSLSLEEIEYYRLGMNKIYHSYLDDLLNNNRKSIIYKAFLNYQGTEYLENTLFCRMVIDFIASMTDAMFLREMKRIK